MNIKSLKSLIIACSSLVLFTNSNYCYSMEELNMSYDEEEKNNSFINNEENNNPESNNINSMNNIDTINNINNSNNIIEEISKEEANNNRIISNEGDNSINNIKEDDNISQYSTHDAISKEYYDACMNNLNNLIQELLVLTSLNNLYGENIFSAYHQSDMWCKELRWKINEFIIPNINAIIKFDTKDCPALKMNMDPKKYIDIERLCNKFSQVNHRSYNEIYIYLRRMVTTLLKFNYGYYNYFDNILAPRYNQHLLKLAIVLNEMKKVINSIFYFDSEFNDSFCYQTEATLDNMTADVLHKRFSDLESERVIDEQINNNNDLNFGQNRIKRSHSINIGLPHLGQNRIKRSNSMHTKLPSKYALNKEAIKQEPINDFQIGTEKLLPKREINFTLNAQDNNNEK